VRTFGVDPGSTSYASRRSFLKSIYGCPRNHRKLAIPGIYPALRPPWYDHNLELEDCNETALILAKAQARFILSLNDHPEMRKALQLFKINPARLK
jgi:hypothetical protein